MLQRINLLYFTMVCLLCTNVTHGDFITAIITEINPESFIVQAFDSNLGTLTKVTYSLQVGGTTSDAYGDPWELHDMVVGFTGSVNPVDNIMFANGFSDLGSPDDVVANDHTHAFALIGSGEFTAPSSILDFTSGDIQFDANSFHVFGSHFHAIGGLISDLDVIVTYEYTATAVPEPSSALFMAVALCTFATHRARTRRTKR